MLGFGILSGLLFLPLVGVAFILALRGNDEATINNARWAALAVTLIILIFGLLAALSRVVSFRQLFGGR